MSNIFSSIVNIEEDKVIIEPKSLLKQHSLEEKRYERLKEMNEKLEEKLEALQLEIQQSLTEKDNLHNEIDQQRKEAKEEICEMEEVKRQEIEQRAARIYEDAKETGWKAGYDQGHKQVTDELSTQKQQIQTIIEKAYEERTQMLANVEVELLELSINIAKKIIGDELQQHPSHTKSVITTVLKQQADKEEIIVQVSVEDFSEMKSELKEIARSLETEATIKVIPIDTLQQGDYVLVTENGSFDGKIDSQLAEIKSQFLSYYKENRMT